MLITVHITLGVDIEGYLDEEQDPKILMLNWLREMTGSSNEVLDDEGEVLGYFSINNYDLKID